MHQHDHERLDRIGMPEAVLCSAKTDEQLRVIGDELASSGSPVLFTRLSANRAELLPAGLDYDEVSQTGVFLSLIHI